MNALFVPYFYVACSFQVRFNQNIIYVIEVQTRNKIYEDEWRRLVPAAQRKSAEEPPSEVEEEVGYRQGNQCNNQKYQKRKCLAVQFMFHVF